MSGNGRLASVMGIVDVDGVMEKAERQRMRNSDYSEEPLGVRTDFALVDPRVLNRGTPSTLDICLYATSLCYMVRRTKRQAKVVNNASTVTDIFLLHSTVVLSQFSVIY